MGDEWVVGLKLKEELMADSHHLNGSAMDDYGHFLSGLIDYCLSS